MAPTDKVMLETKIIIAQADKNYNQNIF